MVSPASSFPPDFATCSAFTSPTRPSTGAAHVRVGPSTCSRGTTSEPVTASIFAREPVSAGSSARSVIASTNALAPAALTFAAYAAPSMPSTFASAVAADVAASPDTFVLSMPTTPTSRSVISGAPALSTMSARLGHERARVSDSFAVSSGATILGDHATCHAPSTSVSPTVVW